MQNGVTLTDSDFDRFRHLIHDICGIRLSESKRELLRCRLAKRVATLGLGSFEGYWGHVRRDRTGQELLKVVDAISTNKTDFFRESAHFDFLQATALPEFFRRRHPVRMWSAACSSGEEPYTMAMTVLEANPGAGPSEVRILATDIASSALERAREGVYDENIVAPIPPALRRKYLQRGRGEWRNHYRVKDRLRRLVTFAHLNLMAERFPMRNPFEVIFCRNVMIYFDRPTQERLIEKLVAQLSAGGYLIIGHSETLNAQKFSLEHVMSAVYRKG